MKKGNNRFAMSFRKAGSQEAYTPGSASAGSASSASPAAASAVVPGAARPAKKSRFSRAGGGAVPQSGASGSVKEVQGR